MKDRKAILKPKYIQWRVIDNKIAVRYDLFDHINQSALNEIYINFEPSDELKSLMEKEINQAIKKEK